MNHRYISLSKIKQKGHDKEYIRDYGIKHLCPLCHEINYFGLTEYEHLINTQIAPIICTSCKKEYLLFTDE